MVSVLIAYGMLILVPVLVLGFSAMINSVKTGLILSYVLTIASLTYFNKLGIIPSWVIFLVYIILAIVFVFVMRSILGGRD